MGVLLTIRIPLSVVSLKPSPLNSKGRNCISWNPLQHMVPGWYLPMKETHVWFERWKPRGRHYYLQAGTAICAARQVKWSEVAQSGLTLCDPMDYSLQGSSVHGISQARVLEWVAISFSRGSSQARNWTEIAHIAGSHFTIWATREPPQYTPRAYKTRFWTWALRSVSWSI